MKRKDDNSELIRLWVSRIMVLLGGHKELISTNGFSDEKIASELGLNTLTNLDKKYEEEFCQKKALLSLRKKHQELESQSDKYKISGLLDTNIKRLSNILLLSDVDQKVLAFAILLYTEELLSESVDLLGTINFKKTCKAIATTIGVNSGEVVNTLKNNGSLSRTGVVYVDHGYNTNLSRKIEIISVDFAERMLMPEDEPTLLLKDIILSCSGSELNLKDFEHIRKSLDILMPYLNKGLDEVKSGINVLIYGPPGTGKSQLTRVIAQELEVPIYEIAREDSEGEPIDAKKRLRAFKAAQSIFSGNRNILLFDEVEDIFDNGSSLLGIKSTASKHKSWINRALEESDVPTIWLTNSVQSMDSAFIRRFDMVIKLSVPPRKQRESIANKLCHSLVTKDTIERIVDSETISPAVLSRAIKVVNSIDERMTEDDRGQALLNVVDSTIQAQGHRPLKNVNKDILPVYYDPNIINADLSLTSLADNIGKSKSARLCIYGPPGTGKTAYGKWLAKYLGIPLHIKRGSDLISMWAGETEKNIAEAFYEAEEENAILLIDEVDSFLQDRRKASQSWQITEVNEMLTQMESFSGIFIASTNLVDDLDQASLRRFDIKTKFGYLREDQAWILFVKLTEQLGITVDKLSKNRISMLKVLTPGDYNVISRRNRLQPFTSSLEIVKVLEEECLLKEEGKFGRPIGFVHSEIDREFIQ